MQFESSAPVLERKSPAGDSVVSPVEGGRPVWAMHLRTGRQVRQWTQVEMVRQLRAASPSPLPDDAAMLRQWKRWESGKGVPGEFYRPLIAAVLGTSAEALFAAGSGGVDGTVGAPRLREHVSVFGEVEPWERQMRAEVRMTLYLTADELMGLIVFGGPGVLTLDELDDDQAVMELVRFSLAYCSVEDMREWVPTIRRMFAGQPGGIELPDGYLPKLRRAVARIFGVVA